MIKEGKDKEIEKYFKKRKSADFIFAQQKRFGIKKDQDKNYPPCKLEENLDGFIENIVTTNLDNNYTNGTFEEYI